MLRVGDPGREQRELREARAVRELDGPGGPGVLHPAGLQEVHHLARLVHLCRSRRSLKNVDLNRNKSQLIHLKTNLRKVFEKL